MQFENDPKEQDPFGLDSFLTEVIDPHALSTLFQSVFTSLWRSWIFKSHMPDTSLFVLLQIAGSKKRGLDGIGKSGGMAAGGGGGSYDDYASGSGRSKVNFQKGGH